MNCSTLRCPVPIQQGLDNRLTFHVGHVSLLPHYADKTTKHLSSLRMLTSGTQNEQQLEDAAEESVNKVCRPGGNSRSTPRTTESTNGKITTRRPAQTSTRKGHSAQFGKREGVCSPTRMAYCTDVIAEHSICLSYDIRQSNNYICQFQKSLHTQLGRSIKLNFFI